MFVLLACAPPSGMSDSGAQKRDTADAATTEDGGTTEDSGTTEDGGTRTEATLLSLNLHCFKLDGTTYSDNDARFAAIAATATSAGVEALLLQEACRSDREGDATERLAEALTVTSGAAWSSVWAYAHLGWEGTADEAEEGVALLVRGMLDDSEAFVYAAQGALQRVALSGTWEGLRLTTVHLEYDDADARRLQARQTASAVLVGAPEEDAAILAGDFNALASDEAVTDLTSAGLVRLSEAADDGTAIDHLFAPRSAGFVVTEARSLFTGGDAVSDHPGVLVHLTRGTSDVVTDTRLVAQVDAGFGHHLALRGDTLPLDWSLGWPGVATADDRWEARFLGWEGAVAYKWLRDDVDWEVGDNHAVTAGSTDTVSPSF